MEYIDKLSVRQICFVFLALIPINKLLILPSILSSLMEERLYLPIIINYTLDILVVAVALNFSKRYPNKTFFQILCDNFGNMFAKFLFFLFGIFMILKAFTPIIEQKHYIENTLYEIMPNIFVFFPIFSITIFASTKKINVLGRCSDLSIWFTAIGLALVFYLSVTVGDYTNLLPIIQKPTFNIFTTSFKTANWYTGGAYMFLFLGHFDNEKHYKRKILLSYTIMSFAVLILTIIFYAIFGSIAKTQTFAIPDMTVYSVAIANVGRFDFLAIFILLFSGVYAICLPIFTATRCFVKAFSIKNVIYPIIIINLLLIISISFLNNKLFQTIYFFQNYLNYFIVFIGYILPFILFFIIPRRKKNASN